MEAAGAAMVMAKGEAGDVVTSVDRDAETAIVAAISEVYPDHAILGEESGLHGSQDGEYRCMGDPLDGTNNCVLGINLYGACITLCRGEAPLVAVCHDSMRRAYAAVRGQGATRNGEPISMAEPGPLRTETVSWLEGYSIAYDDPVRLRMFAALERASKRVLRTWAPSIDWGLLAAGRVAAMIAHRTEAWDLTGGTLLAVEAGAVLRVSSGGHTVLVAHPSLINELALLLDLSP